MFAPLWVRDGSPSDEELNELQRSHRQLERELSAERALADRLAHWLGETADEFRLPAELETSVSNALAAWKAARTTPTDENSSGL